MRTSSSIPNCAVCSLFSPAGLMYEVVHSSRSWAVASESGLGKTQVDSAMRWIGPSRGDRLLAGEEVETLHPVGFAVSGNAGFRTAERVVRNWDRDRHIDSNHSD